MSESDSENPRNYRTIRNQFMDGLYANDNVTELHQRFGALDSNFERVDFVLDLLKSSKISIDFRNDRKNDEVAVKLREQGNCMFKIKKLKEAWEFYTKSICHAEENSVNLGLAYANRSAVLFELNLHSQCLMDIKRAFEHNYPDHLKSKLFIREKNSKNLELGAFTKPHETVPAVTDPNSKVQCGSGCLEIREDTDFGRYVVAARDIKAGEILAVEKPFVVLLVDQYLSHCHECVGLCYNLIPCKDCTQALYCSENCRDQAFEKYHKYECPILVTIKYLELYNLNILPLRIAFLVTKQHNEIENLIINPDEIYQSDRYKEIHNLITNCSKRSKPDLFERSIVAAVLFNLAKEHAKFFENTNVKGERIFKELLLLHMQTGPSNFHEITELSPNYCGTYEPEEIASGAFAFLSLLNHSCCPNVTRFCYGSTLVLTAIQDIKKGEQCFDNYGYHYAVMSRSERQQHLKRQYYFNCVCEACENDWGLYTSLSDMDDLDLDDSLVTKLRSADVAAAKDVIEKNLEELGSLQKLQPCKKFCQLQEIVKQCFAIFGNKRRIF